MQFVKPMPFEEALTKLGERSIVASDLTSEQWGAVPLALRERAFFSSRGESVRFLQRARDSVTDFLASNREVLDNGQVALKTGGRSDFVKGMQDFLKGEGVERTTGGLRDIAGQKRLELIFDVQTRQAQDFGYWKQGQDPDVLDAFPAQRFIRVVEVKEPRNAHQDFEGAVALKSNLTFWTRINQDFGVPWGPWGWGCGHDVEDVDRAEAEAMGLIKVGEQPVPVEKEFNDRLEAGTQGLDGDMVRFLEEAFGDQVDIGQDSVRWNERARRTSPAAQGRTLDALAAEYAAADAASRGRMIQEARRLIEIPQAERGQVGMVNQSQNSAVRQAAVSGAHIVSRYTAPELLARTKVEVRTSKKRRAFHRNGEVHLHSTSGSSTAAHEIMHAVEQQNPKVLEAAAKFLLGRAGAEAPARLSKLTGHKGYSADEVAFEDDWVKRKGSVYAGKLYSFSGSYAAPADIRATEVLTMGIERLHADPLEFYVNDRGYFDFVVKTLRNL